MTLIAAPTRVPMAEGLKRGGLLHPVAIHPKPHRGQSTVEACKRVTQLNPPCNGVFDARGAATRPKERPAVNRGNSQLI